MNTTRRDALKTMSLGAAGITAGKLSPSAKSYTKILGSNDRINIAVIGVRGQGNSHLKRWAKMAEDRNVFVRTICDVDENLFDSRVKEIGEIQGEDPGTEVDMQKVFADPDVHAVSIATPNHWHALATIWAVQNGKDVYVEKPSSHNVWEGRKMVEAADKYGQIVQVGFQNRSINNVRQAMQQLHDGVIGEVYMAKGLCYKPRDSFGLAEDSPVPEGVHYDKWLGPAQEYPFNEKKFHYNWHWHWATGSGDNGNQGPHQYDIARWGLNKNEHPVRISSIGGYYVYGDLCSQETPNTQLSTFEYTDGKIIQFEVRGLPTAGEAPLDVKIGNLFYGSKGWMEISGSKWATYMGRENEPGLSSKDFEDADAASSSSQAYLAAPGLGGHYDNFIAAVKSRSKEDLTCPMEVGHMSSCLPLLSNTSYRVGRPLSFIPEAEQFSNDPEANALLTRKYRAPYVVPETV